MQNFDVRLRGSRETGYLIEVTGSPAGETPRASRMPLPLDSPAFQSTLTNMRELMTNRRMLKDAGTLLFDALFQGPVRRLYSQSMGIQRDEGLRLRLRIDPPELMDLPWEFLYDEEETGRFVALSRETPMARYLPRPRPTPTLAVEPPLRILVLLSSPTDRDQLDIGQERALIEAALEPLTREGQVHLDVVDEPSLAVFQDRLRDDPHVLHFVGHGQFEKGEGALLFLNPDGTSRPVDAETLEHLLTGTTLRLAVLSACESAVAGRENPFMGLAPALVKAGLPAVVAMQFDMPDDSGVIFGREFYRALADLRPVDLCVTEARLALQSEMGLGQVDWGIPVLFMRAEDGVLWQRPTEAAGVGFEGQIIHGAMLIRQYFFPGEVHEVRSNLPPRLDHFVDREAEIQYLKRVLQDAKSFVVVTGMAGIGKTALVLETAHQVAKEGVFADGIIWVDGRELTGHTSILDHLGTMLGIPSISERNADEKEHLIVVQVADHDRLLIFDNFDWVVGATDRTVRFIRGIPCAVLVTSRRWLHTSDQPMQITPLGDEGSLRLFQEISDLGPESIDDDVRRLCIRELEGHPLAIEIVAAQARIAPVTEILESLEESPLDTLVQDEWTALEPLSIVRALSLSYDQLSPEAKVVFVRCSVFTTEFDMAALGAVCPEFDLMARYRRVQELIGKSLLQRKDHRLRLHAVTRKYAYAQLADAPRYHRLAAEYYLIPEAPHPLLAAEQFLEAGDYERAVALLSEHCQDMINEGQASRMVDQLVRFDLDALEPALRFDVLETRQKVWELLGKRALQGQDIEAVTNTAEQMGDESRLVTAYLAATRYHEKISEYDEAQEAAERARALSVELGDRSAEAEALRRIGGICQWRSSYREALHYYEMASQIHREAGDLTELGKDLNEMGYVHFLLGDYEEALRHYDTALKRLEEAGAQWFMADNHLNTGLVYWRLGEHERALDLFRQSQVLYRRLGARMGQASALGNMGIIQGIRDEYEAALESFHHVLEVSREAGDKFRMGIAFWNIGVTYSQLGCHELGEDYLQKSLLVAREIGDRVGESEALRGLGQIYISQMQADRALENVRQARDIAIQTESKHTLLASQNELSVIYRWIGGNGNLQRALDCAGKVFTMATEASVPHAAITALSNQAMAYLAMDDLEEALAQSQEAIDLLADQGGQIEGPEEEFYFNHYQILAANGMDEEAARYLEMARDGVMQKAAKIVDEEFRESFLSRVPLNRQILETAG